MTALLVFAVLLLAWRNLLTQHKYNMVIAELAPALTTLQQRLNKIFLEVQALKDREAAAQQIPAEAQALIDNLTATLDALDAVNADVPSGSPLP